MYRAYLRTPRCEIWRAEMTQTSAGFSIAAMARAANTSLSHILRTLNNATPNFNTKHISICLKSDDKPKRNFSNTIWSTSENVLLHLEVEIGRSQMSLSYQDLGQVLLLKAKNSFIRSRHFFWLFFSYVPKSLRIKIYIRN